MPNLYLILKYEDFFVTWGPRLLSWLHLNVLNGWGKIKKITIFIKHIQDWLLILLFTACLQRSPTNWVLSLTPLPVVLPSSHLHCEESSSITSLPTKANFDSKSISFHKAVHLSGRIHSIEKKRLVPKSCCITCTQAHKHMCTYLGKLILKDNTLMETGWAICTLIPPPLTNNKSKQTEETC